MQSNNKLALVCFVLKVNLCENHQKQQKEAPSYFELETLDTLPYMPSEYCGKQQSGICIWPLGRLRTTETSFGAEITTVG